MLVRLAFAIAVAIVVFVACLILAVVLDAVKVDVLSQIADLLRRWGIALAIAAGLVSFVTGRTSL